MAAPVYRFEAIGTAAGPNEIESLIGAARTAVIARHDFGAACQSADDWCARWAEQLAVDPGAIAVEAFAVKAADGALAFTLVATPWSDSGNLFVRDTAEIAPFALWPEGFKPEGADADALSRAFRDALQAQQATTKKKKKKKKKNARKRR